MKTVTISDSLYECIKDKVNVPLNDLQDLIGKKFFFRTVTYHFTGRVIAIIANQFLVLQDAAWIADSGRFSDAFKTGKLNEVEPLPDQYIVNIQTVTDFGPWSKDLPLVQQ